MDVQICGMVMATICIVCGTVLLWKKIDSKRMVEERKNAARRASHDRVFDDETWAMYEAERAARKDAETREGIAKEQLRQEREKVVRLEQFLSDCKVKDIEKVAV